MASVAVGTAAGSEAGPTRSGTNSRASSGIVRPASSGAQPLGDEALLELAVAAAESGGGGGQDQGAHAARMAGDEVLGQHAADGVAEQVDLVEPEPVEKGEQGLRQCGEGHRRQQRGAAVAGKVPAMAS